jgi:hypothetical protein
MSGMRALTIVVLGCALACPAWAKGKKKPVAADPFPLVEVVATTDLKSTPAHRDAYVESLVRQAADALKGLNPAKREPGAERAEGTAHYRLLVEHHGSVHVAEVRQGFADVDLTDKAGRIIQEKVGKGYSWSVEYGEEGSVNYKLLEWKGKEAGGYATLRTWSGPMTDHTYETIAKVALVPRPLPGGGAEISGYKVVVGNQPPAIPLTPAEVAAKKQELAESIRPRFVQPQVREGLIECVQLKVTPGPRRPDGRAVNPKTGDAVQVRIINHTPWLIHDMAFDTSWVGERFSYKAHVQWKEPIEPNATVVADAKTSAANGVPLHPQVGKPVNPTWTYASSALFEGEGK